MKVSAMARDSGESLMNVRLLLGLFKIVRILPKDSEIPVHVGKRIKRIVSTDPMKFTSNF